MDPWQMWRVIDFCFWVIMACHAGLVILGDYSMLGWALFTIAVYWVIGREIGVH